LPSPSRGGDFRNYGAGAPSRVRTLYRENHTRQTLDFVLERKARYLPLRRARMGVWAAMAQLESLVDESDPDLDLAQIHHAFQTAEALRTDGQPRWLVLTGLLHDLGKVLCLFGEPQWAVVGDTFPVGCAFDPAIVHADLFAENPDRAVPGNATAHGIYSPHCGLDAIQFSWGHDEYLYHVLREHLPEPALDVIRYHSFYAGHAAGAYTHLLGPRDAERLERVRRFSAYDLYTKSASPVDVAALRPFYEDLVAAYLPGELAW
jgi:inositol oxygenase